MSNINSDNTGTGWMTIISDSIGAFAAVWGVALGVLLVGVPIALTFALALRLARMVFPAL